MLSGWSFSALFVGVDWIMTEASQPYNAKKLINRLTKEEKKDMKKLKFKTYIDKAVVEEETKSGRDGDECLLYFILDNISHDLFDVGTSFGVETVA